MDIAELFKGIAVIVDDEIEDKNSTIYSIKKQIEKNNIPVVAYKEIPNKEMIPSLSNSAFLIVDWDYTRGKLELDDENERIYIPQEFADFEKNSLIEFLTLIDKEIFVPVFIFTAQNIENIKDSLQEAGLWFEGKQNKIFIKSKSDVSTENDLFNSMKTWLKEMPSAYVLKEWERGLQKAKDLMFIDFYKRSPEWVCILWELMKNDSLDYQRDLCEFISKSLTNRIDCISFDETYIKGINRDEITNEELVEVIECERFISYSNETQPSQIYTGDLFSKGSKYYLNIRAQCDLSREEDPCLYLIKGEKIRDRDIVTEPLKLTSDCKLDFGNNNCESIEDIKSICNDSEKIKAINNKIKSHQNKIFLRYGSFIERADKVIIGCIAGEKAIQFQLELISKKRSELDANRIGRLLPPYITRIQQKCSLHIIREGIMPIIDCQVELTHFYVLF